MFEPKSAKDIIKKGIFLYDNKIKCALEIFITDIKYGSGDCEDPPAISDDKNGLFFCLRYEFPTKNGFQFGGYFDSLAEAIKNAEKLLQTVEWT